MKNIDPSKIIIGIGIAVVIIFFVIVIFFRGGPEAPTHLLAESMSSSEIMLSWDGNEGAQFDIYRAEDSQGDYIRIGFSRELEYLDQNLEPAKDYYYKVKQIINFSESDYSFPASARTAPSAPIGLRANNIDFQEDLRLRIDLFWDYTIGAEKYFVYRTIEEGGVYEKISEVTRERYSDFDLDAQTTYYYVITQVNQGEESIYSKEASATTETPWHCGDVMEYGGRTYNTKRIEDQCWFLESLNVEKGETYNDCDITKYCLFNNEAMCVTYGGLYTFSDALCGQSIEGSQGICPLGWRIPTDDDWILLETGLGVPENQAKTYGYRGSDQGSRLAGRYDLWKEGILKGSSFFGSSEINILPGGYQPGFNLRRFYDSREKAILWSSTRLNDEAGCGIRGTAYGVREIIYNQTGIKRDCHNGTAQVRCMRDY